MSCFTPKASTHSAMFLRSSALSCANLRKPTLLPPKMFWTVKSSFSLKYICMTSRRIMKMFMVMFSPSRPYAVRLERF